MPAVGTAAFTRGCRTNPQRRACLSANRLADPEQVPLAVAEPGGALALAALARVVPLDLRDPVHGPQSRQVDLLELNAAPTQLGHGGLDVVHLPPHLGEGAGRSARRFEQTKLAVLAAVAQPSRPLLDRLEAERFGVERPGTLEGLGGQPRRNLGLLQHRL